MLKTAVLHLPEPRTPLYPLTEQRLTEAARPLVERLQAWKMMGVGLNTTDFNGKPVRYHGVKFEGSPRDVFWSNFFEPFILDAARQTLEWVVDCCRERHLEPRQYVVEAKSLLALFTDGVYEDMARIDQNHRGGGYPHSVTPMDVSPKATAMKEQIDNLAVALTHSGKPAPSPSPASEEIFLCKSNLYGIGFDLKLLCRRLLKIFSRTP